MKRQAGLTRRDFVAGGMCLAAANALPATERIPNLRVGILSDVHVDGAAPATKFERALRYFDARKVDAVLISGDLVTWGRRREFDMVAATWFKVFPDDRRSDGVRIERLFVTGNHDVDGFAYAGARYTSVAEAKEDSFYYHREAYWRDLFHEDYRPVTVKTVKGYSFVLRNWLSILDPGKDWPPFAQKAGCRAEPNPVPEFLASLNLPKDRPFFYVQHEMPNDTVNASWLVGGARWSNGHDDGFSTRFLSDYPNCIAFSGHCHNSLTDEMSIWQGTFTAVNCSCCCGYAFMAPGRENGWCCDDFGQDPPFEMESLDIHSISQGLVMEVFDDAVVLERRDFRYGHRLGPDWVIPTGAQAPRPYAPTMRLKAAKRPAFSTDAAIRVWCGDGYGRDAAGTGRAKTRHAQVYVSFPPVRMRDGSPARGWDYSVRAELSAGAVVKTLRERCVYSEGAFYAEEDETEPVICAFNRRDLPMRLNRRQKVRFVVTPRTCWRLAGEPIRTAWMSVDEIEKGQGR